MRTQRQREQQRESMRRYYARHREEVIARSAAHTARARKEHPERWRAWYTVWNALQSGSLEKQPCEKCGLEEKVHAHHDDYFKPLDVRWLCPVHHAELKWGTL